MANFSYSHRQNEKRFEKDERLAKYFKLHDTN